MFRKKSGFEKGSIGKRFIISFAISAVIILTVALVCAIILNSLDDITKSLGIFSLIGMLVSAALSGVISARLGRDEALRFASLVALSVVLIMLLINVIACRGRVTGGAFMNYGCYLGVATLSAYFSSRRSSRPRRRH